MVSHERQGGGALSVDMVDISCSLFFSSLLRSFLHPSPVLIIKMARLDISRAKRMKR